MMGNQDQEDVKSYPMLYKHKSGLFEPVLREDKLWVKRKIPKDGGGVMDFEDQIIGFQEKDQMNGRTKNIRRVCHICHKAFSSGKALGGHMRIHVHKVNNKDLVSKKSLKAHKTIKFKKQNPREEREIDIKKKKKQYKKTVATNHNGSSGNIIMKPISCVICGKDFRSMKSLFGHMRCHPERDWRGIRPPSTVKNSSNSSFSDAEPGKCVDHDQILATSEANKAVDLTKSLMGWPVTARRGREALAAQSTSEFSSSEEQQLHKAIDHLMRLAQGDSSESGVSDRLKVESCEAANSNSPVCKAKVMNFSSGAKSNKEQIDQSSAEFRTHSQVEQHGNDSNEEKVSNNVERTALELGLALGESVNKFEGGVHLKEHVQNYCLEQLDDTDFESANSKVLIKNRKKRKRVKLSELELAQKVSPMTPAEEKVVVRAAAAPPPDKYKCKTCAKSFPSHQALGGHRSSHNKFKIFIHDSIGKSGNISNPASHAEEEVIEKRITSSNFPTAQAHAGGLMEGPTSQVISPGEASRTSCKMLDLDLNELPPSSEDEVDFDSDPAVGNCDYATFSTNCDYCVLVTATKS